MGESGTFTHKCPAASIFKPDLPLASYLVFCYVGAMAEDRLTLGTYFKQERERRGIDLKEIEERTKISAQTLAFLEEDRLDLLPPRAFVRGFLMTIARDFSLDTEELLRFMEAAYRMQKESEPYRLGLSEVETKPRPSFRWLIIILIALLIAAGLVLFCSRTTAHSSAASPAPVTAPADATAPQRS